MAFNFPSAPTEGQEYVSPVGSVYRYEDSKWNLLGGSQAAAPLPPIPTFRNRIINGDFAVDRRGLILLRTYNRRV
jgi:hypothetical protein